MAVIGLEALLYNLSKDGERYDIVETDIPRLGRVTTVIFRDTKSHFHSNGKRIRSVKRIEIIRYLIYRTEYLLYKAKIDLDLAKSLNKELRFKINKRPLEVRLAKFLSVMLQEQGIIVNELEEIKDKLTDFSESFDKLVNVEHVIK